MKKLMFMLMLVPFMAQADVNSTSQAASGSFAGSASQTSTYIDQSGNVSQVDAAKMERLVAPVFAPALSSGTNPCAISISGGITIPGIGGIAGGGVYNDKDCNVRENLRIVGAMVRKDDNPTGAILIKNIACQSAQLWDAIEMTAIESGDTDMACRNERPDDPQEYVVLRPQPLPQSYDSQVAHRSVIEPSAMAVSYEDDSETEWFAAGSSGNTMLDF